jgi:hypothetical protein
MIVSNYGPDLLRCAWIAICIERAIATYLKDNYEKKNLSVIWITLSVAMHVVCIFMGYVKFYCKF